MRIFKVVKTFQGGQTTYGAILRKGVSVIRGHWKYQLQEWGEGTNGGHNYGWRIRVTEVTRYPRVKVTKFSPEKKAIVVLGTTRATRLHFLPDYLEKKPVRSP